MKEKKLKFAVILSGCGNRDGAEIHESVLTLLAIKKLGSDYQCFAPDIKQHRVVNFLTGENCKEERNVLQESARIARGDILDLSQFNASEYDVLIMPGGQGAALNLSTFGTDRESMGVNDEVVKAVCAMVEQSKPIGALCIAPVILGQLLSDVKITFGNDEGVNEIFRNRGASCINTVSQEIVIDEKYNVVTSPCYMLDADIVDVSIEAEKVVKALIKMATQ